METTFRINCLGAGSSPLLGTNNFFIINRIELQGARRAYGFSATILPFFFKIDRRANLKVITAASRSNPLGPPRPVRTGDLGGIGDRNPVPTGAFRRIERLVGPGDQFVEGVYAGVEGGDSRA